MDTCGAAWGAGWLEVVRLKSGDRNAEPVRSAAGRWKRLRTHVHTQTQPELKKHNDHSIWFVILK